VHAAEDYLCKDYKCFALDTVATNILINIKVFVAFTSVSCFCRTLKNKYKEVEGGLFKCN